MPTNSSSSEVDGIIAELQQELQRLKVAEKAYFRQNASLEALHETSLGLIDKLDKEELLEHILERAASLSGTVHGYIYLLDSSGRYLQMKVGMGFFKSQLGRRVIPGQGVGGRVWQTARPVVVKDYQSWSGRISDQVLDRLRSIVGIPLKYDRRIHGVIGLAHVDGSRHFSDDDITALERFAALALLALEKANLYGEARRELNERKRTESFWRESENRYKTFLESSPDPIVVYDMQGVATYVNPAFEQTFKLSREELLGKQIDFVPPESVPETRAAIERMLSGQKIHLFETRRLTKDGEILDVQLSSTLYQDENGMPQGNIVTLRDISEQKRVEQELNTYRHHLEELVSDRTAELAAINLKLEREVEDRKKAERALRKRERELKAQSLHLAEVNTALKVLLKQHDEGRRELGESVVRNIQDLVTPYLQKLGSGRLNHHQQTLAHIIETNLKNIVSPFVSNINSGLSHLTPVEIRVASLVKDGMTNKEIAEVLRVSKNTVLFHRHNIRDKLKIKHKKINLRSYLLSMAE